MKKRTIIASLLAAAFLLRLIFVFYYPVTLDEAWSFFVSGQPLGEILGEIKADSTSPVLIYLVHKIMDLNQSGAGIRWFFGLMNFASVFYLMGFCGNYAAAAFFFAFSGFLIIEGSIARMHSLNLFFASGLIYFFWKTFEREKKSDFLMVFIFSLFLAYNFYPAMALPPALFLSWAVLRRYSVSRPGFYFKTLIFLVLFSLPAFYFLDSGVLNSRFVNPLRFTTGAILPYLVYSFSYSEVFLKFGEIRGFKILYFAFLLSIPLFFLFSSFQNRKSDPKLIFSFYAILFSLLAVIGISFKIPKVLYSPKYLMWITPFFFYALIRGFEFSRYRFKAYLLFFILFFNIAAYGFSLVCPRENWRETAALIEQNEKPGDSILLYAEQMKYPFSFYYRGKNKFTALPNDKKYFELSTIPQKGRVWFMDSHDYDGSGKFYLGKLEKTMKKKAEYKLKGIEIGLYGEK